MEREHIVLLHAIAGVIVFAAGFLQIFLKKGGKTHRIIGQVYLWTWLVLLITGALIGSFVITMLGIFGFYLAYTGARIGHFKQGSFSLFDKCLMGLAALTPVYMLYYAVALAVAGNTSFAIISAAFGLFFGSTCLKDVRKYLLGHAVGDQSLGKMDWYFEHLTRMSGSFIAACTAFASIQDVFRHPVANFLLPTVIGSALIAMTVRKYKKQFGLVATTQ